MEFPILKDILIIFALSTLVNYAFNRIKVPTIVGYLLTGVLAGPHLTGIVTSSESIHTLAEIGVVLLLFTIGLEFSLKHLIKIRRVVFVGGFMQVFATAALIMLVARSYEMDLLSAVFIGFITALSSTAVVLKVLQDRSELTSNYGRTVLGILIFQDILLVPLLLFTPLLGGETEGVGSMIFYLGLKSILIIAIVYVGHKWVMPWILHVIAMTKNQELYFMSVLLICLGIAFLTNEMGMSLAFGAFLAGLMISESEHSHHIYGHIIPFKDIFTSFFFVSIGMMLDLEFVLDNLSLVLITVLIVIGIKAFVAGMTGFVLGHTFRGFILVGLALAQVGEFSFILVQLGLGYGIVSDFYYQLFLATAVTTMSLTPFQIMLSRPLSAWLVSFPLPKVMIEGMFPLKQVEVPVMENHLVLIGKDSRSRNISAMAGYIHLPYIAIAFDPAEVKKRQEEGEIIIYGDAANEPILRKAHVETAEVVVVSIGDMITAMSIIERVRHLNKHAAIFVRTRYVEDVEDLYRVGATQVIPEEFETAIEVFERVLNKYLIPQSDISQIIGRIRKDNYGVVRQSVKPSRFSIMKDLPNIEISALKVHEHSPVVGKNLVELDFRKNAGVTVVAIKRSDLIVENPMAETRFKKGDVVYVLGKQDQIAHTVKMFMGK